DCIGALSLALHQARVRIAITTGARDLAMRLPNTDARSGRSAGRANTDTRRNTGKDAKIEARNTRNSRYRKRRVQDNNRVARSRPVVEAPEFQRRGAPAG